MRKNDENLLPEMPEEERIGYLAAVGWSDDDLRKYLGLTVEDFDKRLADGNNPVARAIESGRMRKRADIEIAIARGAETGDPPRVKQFADIVRDNSFSISKLDLFGGAENEGAFERIRDYIAGGSKGDLPEKEQVYIDILTLVYSLDGQYGKRRTLRFLTSKPFNFTFEHASNVYAEATELFFCNRKISKDAMRNKIADQFETLYIAARNAATCTKDYEIASNILANKAKALQLDRDDPPKLPAEVYRREYRVLGITPDVIGLPAADRQELARQIDTVVAPDKVKERLRMDAGIDDLDIVKELDNVVEEED